MSWFSFLQAPKPSGDLPEIFPVPIKQKDFIAIDVQAIYTRILTDVFERTDGLNDDQIKLLWDSCMASDIQDGLVTLLAKAMRDKSDLFLIYFADLKLIRKANSNEQSVIRIGYGKKAEPVNLDGGGVGIYVTFKSMTKSDMVSFYSALEYCAIGGVWKQGNISKALQLKFKGMRGNISLDDAGDPKAQGQSLARGLSAGQDIMIDAEDMVENAKPDLKASQSMLDLVSKKQSFYLGLPASYWDGETSGAMNDSGKADAKAVDRGLRPYFCSIAKPVVDGLFSIKVTFKSNDFEMLDSALNVLKTFDVTSDDHLSKDNKTEIVNKVFGLPKDEKGDKPKPEAVIPENQDPNAKPPAAKPAPAG